MCFVCLIVLLDFFLSCGKQSRAIPSTMTNQLAPILALLHTHFLFIYSSNLCYQLYRVQPLQFFFSLLFMTYVVI